uniref:Uncharacterized protein n=1 Tax=Cyprinus carpio carpio TaxID=630221 RepID=A0A9J7WWM6_CYPCA
SNSGKCKFLCPICKNLLTDPVSTTCGHTFCKDCLDKHISRSDSQCPLCQEPVTTKPSVNKAIKALLQEFHQTHLPNLDLFCGERDAIPCDVCDEHLTFKAVKSCLICSLSFCDEHLKPHQSMARFRGHKLVSPVKKLDQRACNTHGRPLELYCRRDERCIYQEYAFYFCPTCVHCSQALLEKEQQEIQEVFAALMEALRKTEQVLLAPLEDGRKCLEKEMDEKTQQIQKDILKYKEAIESLNHGKEVRDTRAGHDIPCGPQQFNLAGGVLGKPDITSGRAFWVVEVGNNVGWELGVMRDGGKREGYVSYKPSKSYWAIMLCAQNMYRALEDPPVQLHLETKPRKLGVFVDCEEALVSFYDMEALSHIYSFTHCSFKRAIRPHFIKCGLEFNV